MKRATKTLGVDWYLPGRKRRFATTPQATSLSISVMGENRTFRETLQHMPYDPEAQEILRVFIDAGYGDEQVSNLVR